ncbi:MAG: Fe2+-dependent dioxygenase [Candidatus Promineifilaceae bacterium]|nr:Fe2+-dependent dioxygenase [Candidatus Promineifilaceae bacterium]
MILTVPEFLTDSEVQTLRDIAAHGQFIDGSATGGRAGRVIKRNEQLQFTDEAVGIINKMIQGAIQRNEDVQNFAWPRCVNTPLISRYAPGMEYGGHFDNPILFSRRGEPLRSDISMTVFLSVPGDYDGGELHLDTPFGSQKIKLPAGHAFLYPTTMYHRVTPVSKGIRLAAVTWIQSLIKEPDRRQILYDLARARQAFRDNRHQGGKHLHKAFSNLIKLWSEV